jgi:hypothetical protein
MQTKLAKPLGRVHGLDRVLGGFFRAAGAILACPSALLKASLLVVR